MKNQFCNTRQESLEVALVAASGQTCHTDLFLRCFGRRRVPVRRPAPILTHPVAGSQKGIHHTPLLLPLAAVWALDTSLQILLVMGHIHTTHSHRHHIDFPYTIHLLALEWSYGFGRTHTYHLSCKKASVISFCVLQSLSAAASITQLLISGVYAYPKACPCRS